MKISRCRIVKGRRILIDVLDDGRFHYSVTRLSRRYGNRHVDDGVVKTQKKLLKRIRKACAKPLKMGPLWN